MAGMQHANIAALRRLDLNLLPVLEALLRTGSVTQAAAELHLSQPAVSHALSRLRQALGDPLFVRASTGLVPTAWCRQLGPTLQRLLGEVAGALLCRPAFDPAEARRTFTLGMTDYVALLLLPPLLERLRQQAPHLALNVRLVEQPEWQALELGEVELAVLLQVEDRPGLLQRQLFADEFLCLVRADHPLVGRQLTLERYLELSHLLISPQGQGQGFVDAALAQRGLSRHIALRVPYFLAAPLIAARTDLVLTLPARVARVFAAHFPLRVVALPLELGGFAMHQVWHERHHNDPGHAWLRGLMQEVCDEMDGGEGKRGAQSRR